MKLILLISLVLYFTVYVNAEQKVIIKLYKE